MQINTSFATAAFSGFATRSKSAVAGTDPATMETSPGRKLDFTSMTRKELLDWVNGEIKGGRMTLDESTPFVGMTIKISAYTKQPVDIDTDATRYDFTDIAAKGVDGARSFGNEKLAQALEWSIEAMRRAQGGKAGFDLSA
ncbi:MAG: hypothetical protein C6Y20_12750 [Tagaea sp. CACIAM 22H2]|nr:hypothetical protein [Tagaea sp. CACIAM 22H2]